MVFENGVKNIQAAAYNGCAYGICKTIDIFGFEYYDL